jgi:hypothetical protein
VCSARDLKVSAPQGAAFINLFVFVCVKDCGLWFEYLRLGIIFLFEFHLFNTKLIVFDLLTSFF